MARTNRHIHELSQRIELFHNRVARKSKNPALAAQANEVPAMGATLGKLKRHRKRLVNALEAEAYPSRQDKLVNRPPLEPRHMR